MQVSDKLSAHNSTQLAAALAARLKGTDWSSGTAKEAIVYALLRLGRNMQQLVFREAGKLSADVIFSWPMLLQLVGPYTFTVLLFVLFSASDTYPSCPVSESRLPSSNITLPETHIRSALQ